MDSLAAWRRNPFFVLELKTDATRAEVERAGQRLLALLSIDSAGAGEYVTPFGTATRDADMVRQALGALRDPVQRLTYELWANISLPEEFKEEDGSFSRWEDAQAGLGWGKPWPR